MSWAGADQVDIRRLRGHTIQTSDAPRASGAVPRQGQAEQVLICLSHLRWNFVYQRPQHLMERFAAAHRVIFFEEPAPTDAAQPWLDVQEGHGGVEVAVPRIPGWIQGPDVERVQRFLFDGFIRSEGIEDPILWYYSPMMLPFTEHVKASLVVYDCMDELSAFRGAPPELVERERRLLQRADLVFTGGVSLYEAKRHLHANVHAFPSSVDVRHFSAAREQSRPEPEDQAGIPHPRLGFYGVIDERLDIALIGALADLRPDWQIVLVGPVVKIDPADLPRRENIHYLGPKLYEELPGYLSGWDVALLPFARNESTRFISPTKTPEYLAAGRPVVSTPITDVVRGYGDAGLVRIAETPEDFVAACSAALEDARRPEAWLGPVDRALAGMSWDVTWARMKELMECAA
ncbi:glycosyltransferase family 1 protein [Arenibaculum pallidiluteum]|uniref:glycosyltransferase family 1 protein n=1 Tax=Arenibaculum pallidiluteum TaxID=2812559 RepID=UPI001A96BB31|nr:glycosyltransferase family 1 protein [Arenibaculum pallidiluteum]